MEAENLLCKSPRFHQGTFLVQHLQYRTGIYITFIQIMIILTENYTYWYHKAVHCSVCEHVVLAGGMLCDSCGVCAEESCMKRADKKLKCKPVSIDSISMKHHWVRGKSFIG